MPLCKCGCGEETILKVRTKVFREYIEGHQHSVVDPIANNYTVMPNGCWEWNKSFNTAGYGAFSWRGKTHRAHRFAYEKHYGTIPNGAFICHKCDNRKCINPEHLYAGNNKTNMKDKLERYDWSRMKRGNDHPNRKLSVELVREAYKEWKAKAPISLLMSKYGVSKTSLYSALKGKTWKLATLLKEDV